jgi:hypothetical protein
VDFQKISAEGTSDSAKDEGGHRLCIIASLQYAGTGYSPWEISRMCMAS